VPPRGLPGNANLEQLKNGAKSFQRAVRAGDAGAAEVVREFHPRLHDAQPGARELTGFTRADAQLVVARRFGFPSWPKLKAYLELTARYSRSPHEQPIGGPLETDADRINEFLRLACLTYGGDDPARWAQAQAMLDADPGLAGATIHTAAAAGDPDAARRILAEDPARARRPGGPHDWEPLMYLSYSRVRARDALETARVLLEHGADVNTGYLWEGLSPPFTVLTGAFGSGEGNPPAHGDGLSLARLLLEAGAEPNDSQTLYNRHWDPRSDWLELLFEFGLGTGDGGRWHKLLAPAHETPRQMLESQLESAAHHGFERHVRLLLDHGADPDAPDVTHQFYEGRRPVEEAALWGHRGIAEMLIAAGARTQLDDVDWFVCACTAGDRARAEELLAAQPGLAEQARARRPEQLARAAENGNIEAVRLLLEYGFDPNAMKRTAALHEAAMRGNMPMIELLLAHGADPNLHDEAFDATPRGWAEHHGQTEAERYLRRLEESP
jgi:hypothetical protein